MTNVKKLTSDVLIIGTGIAGLRAAMAARELNASVIVVSKGESASSGVIGFNAVLGVLDSCESYYSDTYEGGACIADKKIVKLMSAKAAEVVTEMEKLDLRFEKSAGNYHLLKPLGCAYPRLVHTGNKTGPESMKLMRKELQGSGCILMEDVVALELLKKGLEVKGVLAVNGKKKEFLIFNAKAVVLAAGGGGNVYAESTYPISITGDSYALAFKAGASLMDMEFVQFEPCRAVYPQKLGISTTLLAKGGELKNRREERFMLKDYPEGEGSAPKDALAQAIFKEIQQGRGTEHGGVYLDLTMLPDEIITKSHSMYYNRFLNAGIDLTKERVEVAPAAHSFMGGIKIDTGCRSSVSGLFAAGEAVGGIHGANRLGGNAGTETYVFGKIAGKNAAQYALSVNNSHNGEALGEKRIEELVAIGREQSNTLRNIMEIKAKIQKTMSVYTGVIRDKEGLKKAKAIFKSLKAGLRKRYPAATLRELMDIIETENMALTAQIVTEAALQRKESRGVHFRADYPEQDDDKWQKNIVVSDNDGCFKISFREKK